MSACLVSDCTYETVHVHCVLCGVGNPATTLCSQHAGGVDEWAKDNQAWCNFFHRHIEPPVDSVVEDVA